jgi:hypothetical protein
MERRRGEIVDLSFLESPELPGSLIRQRSMPPVGSSSQILDVPQASRHVIDPPQTLSQDSAIQSKTEVYRTKPLTVSHTDLVSGCCTYTNMPMSQGHDITNALPSCDP